LVKKRRRRKIRFNFSKYKESSVIIESMVSAKKKIFLFLLLPPQLLPDRFPLFSFPERFIKFLNKKMPMERNPPSVTLFFDSLI
jgi:hypothetical protein